MEHMRVFLSQLRESAFFSTKGNAMGGSGDHETNAVDNGSLSKIRIGNPDAHCLATHSHDCSLRRLNSQQMTL